MLRLPLLFLLFLPTLAFAAKNEMRGATPAELAMKSVDFAPGASAVLLEWDVLHDDANTQDIEYYRFKILTADGKKYGDIEVPYIPSYSVIRDIEARTTRPDGTVIPFTGKTYDKLIIKAGGYKLMNKTFTLPEVQPGAIIEYRFKRSWQSGAADGYIFMPWGDYWFLQREVPILRLKIAVKPFGDPFSNFFTHRGLPTGKRVEKVGDRYEVNLENIPPFEEEAFAPPAGETKPRVNLHYTMGKVDMEKYWTDWVKEATEEVEGFIGNRSGIRKAAGEIIAGAESDEAKLRKLYERVQSIRNLSFEQEKSEQELRREKVKDTRNIEHLLREGYGYRNELNRLFVGLARGAGFDAAILRVSQRDEQFFTRAVPLGHLLESEIASVMVGGAPRYFDPGTPHAALGQLSWENTQVDGVRLEKKKPGTWVMTPEGDTAVTRRQATLELDGDVLKGTVKLTYTGQAALVKRLAAHTHDEATNRKTIEDEAKEILPEGSTVTLKSLSKIDGSGEPLVVELDVALSGVGALTSSRALVPLSVFTMTSRNPFAPESRRHAIYFSYLRRYEDEVTLRVPAGYVVEGLPKPHKLDLGGAQFALDWKQDANGVTLSRVYAINTTSVDLAHYATLRTFFSRLGAADQEAVVFKKAPK